MSFLELLTMKLFDVTQQNSFEIWHETYRHINHQRSYQTFESVDYWTIFSVNSKWLIRRQWFLSQSLFLLSLCVNISTKTIEYRARVQVLINRYKRQTILFFFIIMHESIVDDHEKKTLYSDIFYRIQTSNVVRKMKAQCRVSLRTTKVRVNNLKQKLKKTREQIRKWHRRAIAAQTNSNYSHFEITIRDNTSVDSNDIVMNTIAMKK